MALLDDYLRSKGTNRQQVSEALKVAPSTFQAAAKAEEPSAITDRVKGMLAEALFITPDQVESELDDFAPEPKKDNFAGNCYIAREQIDAEWYGRGTDTRSNAAIMVGWLFTVKRLTEDGGKAIVYVEQDGWHGDWHIPLVALATSSISLTKQEYNAVRAVQKIGFKVLP